MAFRLVLTWPPLSGNNVYFTSRQGRRVLDSRARRWKDEVILTIRQAGLVLPEGDLDLLMWQFPPRGKRVRDTDNLMKLTKDAIFEAFDTNDNRVVLEHNNRGVAGNPPHLEVTIRAHEYEASLRDREAISGIPETVSMTLAS